MNISTASIAIDSPHCIHAPSKSERWGNCPASALEETKYPDKEKHPSAIRGSELHEKAQELLQSLFTKPSWEILDFLQNSILELEPILQFYLSTILKKKLLFPHAIYGIEEKVNIPLSDIYKVYGTVDFFIYDKDKKELHLYDLKTGRIRVHAFQNSQLILYLYGILNKLKIELEELNDCSVNIVQGVSSTTLTKLINIDVKKLENYCTPIPQYFYLDSYKVKPTAYHTIINKSSEAVMQSSCSSPQYKAGSWCMYCKAKEHCQEYKKQKEEI